MSQTISFEQVKHINRSKGYHFYDEGATRFFNSRYPLKAEQVDKYAVFTTSEQYNAETERKYTVRVQDMETGQTFTIGDFNALTKEAAQALKKETVVFMEIVNLNHDGIKDEFEKVLKIKDEKHTIGFVLAKFSSFFGNAVPMLRTWTKSGVQE